MNDPKTSADADGAGLEGQSNRDLTQSALAKNASGVGSWLCDPATGQFSWSEQVYHLLGLDPDAVAAGCEATVAVVDPDDRAATQAWFEEITTARDGSFATEYRVIWPNGERRVLRDMAQFVPDPDSERPLLVGTLRDITDALASERENRRFKASLDATRDGVFMNDVDTLQYFYVNQGALRHTGYSRDELLGMTTLDLNPDMTEKKIRQFAAELETGAAENFSRIGHHRHKDGHLVPVESRTELVRTPGQRPMFITIARDITERLKSEAQIRRFKTTLDATQDGVYLYEADTLQFFYVNAGASAYTGYSSEELLDMKSYDLNPDLDEAKVREAFKDLVSGKVASITRTGFHRKKNGGLVPVEVLTQYITSPDDSPTFVSISRDITLRRRRQAEIEQFKSTLDQVNDRVFMYDPETLRFMYGNESASKALGYTPDELAELKPSDINVSDSEVKIRTIIDDLRSGKTPANVREALHRRKDGSLIPVELSVQYLHPPGEKPRIVTVARDITDRIEARRAAERQQRELERLVNERTDALQEAQSELIKQERLSTLGQLTATVSHELRNPLATIRPALFVLRTFVDDSDSRVRELLDRIERNTVRCDRIIDELLDFTRHRELQLETIAADRCIREIVQDLQIPEGVSFSPSFAAGTATIAVDSEALRRAILNILDNAFHAVAEKHNGAIDDYEPKVRLSTRVNPSGRVEIAVQDNGLGMSTEVKQRLFEPLFSTKGFGVGLGTTIVRNIMQLHEGGIEIDSEAGFGSTFTLWLPICENNMISRND